MTLDGDEDSRCVVDADDDDDTTIVDDDPLLFVDEQLGLEPPESSSKLTSGTTPMPFPEMTDLGGRKWCSNALSTGEADLAAGTIQGLIESKGAEIEKICIDNYQYFISSVSTLFTVKSYADKMKETIASLDTSVAQLGGGLVDKKRNLLQTKKMAANLDEAIDTLQACLWVLDVVNRVSEMVKERKCWSALRSLEDIQSMPPTSIAQTPFFHSRLVASDESERVVGSPSELKYQGIANLNWCYLPKILSPSISWPLAGSKEAERQNPSLTLNKVP
ncbi:hypothetical protein NP233_g8104 [Leucocoprinus birnbaumii]|uniref:Exocyst complex component EXOC6/Sec15 N-terminal domain-containing protein n=1 Tax=Leucocoprinus birnbaumii TaxID=56174 RepID=A0AAD5YNF8_9AGAR|nr:hypothetical protein NP233_g8104 [Leucocoprinus birnbaumii]